MLANFSPRSLLSIACIAASAHAQPPLFSPVESITRARYDLELGFTVQGRVSEVLVQPGDRVEQGRPLIRLDDREGAAQIRLYELRSESTYEIDAAEASWKLAENEALRLEEAMRRDGAAPFEVERARLEAKRSYLAYELYKQRRQETALQLEQARILHEKYTLTAPIAGLIEEVVIEPGEMVEEIRPALRLVVIDPLRIHAQVASAQAANIQLKQPATVQFKDGSTVVQGSVVHIASVADAGSDTRTVVIEIPNPTGHPAGSHVTITWPTDASPAAQTP